LPGPLAGRRLWFVGIGGAGLSGYALLASAWGAEVAGWDKVETPYLENVRAAGIEVAIEPDPLGAPDGWEAVVSTAFAPRVEGTTSRAAFLAELVSLQRAIVVAGAHGKTTTAAMVAFVLDRLGLDPSFLIGGDVPQLGGNARAGSGWLVVEGDESDRTIASLRPEIAVVTNLDLDHHTEFASRAEVEQLFDEWLEHVPVVVRGEALPLTVGVALPGEHNRRNAAAAVAAVEAAGVARADAERAIAEFRGVGRRLELRGGTGVKVYDDYAHNPAKVEAAIAAARELGARVLVVFQPHLFSRTRHLARELAVALSAADAVAVTEIYPAREQPIAGVTGRLVVEALAEVRPGMPVAWTPALEDGARFVAGRARDGDVVLTVGAGDVDRVAPLIVEALA
jgi:UDP-N-acetylmuramate--alanine ligase